MSSIPNSNSCARTFGSSPTNPGMDYLTTKPREVNLVNFRKVAECYQESLTLKRQRQEGLVFPESPSLNVQFEGVRLGDVCNSSYFDSFPVGYRFCPTDQELIVDYLKKKVMDEELPRHKFKHINIYKYKPEELAAMFKGNREKEFYFFTPRDKKYPKGNRPNRAAGGGYWKATGADKKIKFNGKEVGSKKSLVFYRGKPPHGDKTNWIMQEYRVNDPPPCKRDENDMRLDEWVLCKIYKKVDKSLEEKSKQKSRSFRHENNTDAAVPDTVESDIEDDQNTPRCNAGAEDYQAWKPSRFNAEAQDCQAFKLSGFNAAGPADYQAFKPSGCNAAGPADYQAFKPSGCNAAGPADYQAFKPSGCNAAGPVAYQAFKPSGSNAAALVDYQAFKPSRFGPVDYQASKPVPHFNAEAGAYDAEEFQALNFTYGADAEALNSSYWTSPEMEIGEPPLYLTNEDNWEKIFSSENPENSQSLIGKPCRP